MVEQMGQIEDIHGSEGTIAKEMNYSEFCHPFYKKRSRTNCISHVSTQAELGEFFILIALGEEAETNIRFSKDEFKKWFSGNRLPASDVWKFISKNFDEIRFAETLTERINPSEVNNIANGFGIHLVEGEAVNIDALSTALTQQFYSLARGDGKAENIVEKEYIRHSAETEFPAYVRNSQKKYSKMKTLLYTSEERPFYDFFVCNDICIGSPIYPHFRIEGDVTSIIKNATLQKLKEKSQYTLIIGIGGIGKSMMMRHLFLEAMKSRNSTGLLPVLITLREYDEERNNLFKAIVDSMRRFDTTVTDERVRKLLQLGKCQILLDGLDEIRASDVDTFLKELDITVDQYPECQYVMSSRKMDEFVKLPRFTIMGMMPFSREQAIELINNLEFCPEEPRIKNRFLEKLERELFFSHTEFTQNPLLLTLMLMNYRQFMEVPQQQYRFYEEAYYTLLTRHDTDKLAYKRDFRSVDSPYDFTEVFREFCARSFRGGDYEFDKFLFEKYLSKLKILKRRNLPKMSADNFIYDACNSVCLMYEESRHYTFLHRSFQEYFFADYCARQEDSVFIKLGEWIDKSELDPYIANSAYDMLYDMAQEKVEKFIFLPALTEIFREENDLDNYMIFLVKSYREWSYRRINDSVLKKHGLDLYTNNIIEPKSDLIEWMLKVLGYSDDLEPYDSLDYGPDYEECISGSLYAIHYSTDRGERARVFAYDRHELLKMCEEGHPQASPIMEILVYDENGKPEEFGCEYVLDFSVAIKDRQRYAEAIKMWTEDSCPAWEIFYILKKYYFLLKERFETELEDEEDF